MRRSRARGADSIGDRTDGSRSDPQRPGWCRKAKGGRPAGKEATKLQEDIILNFLDTTGPRDFANLRWGIPKALYDKKAALIREWMMEQCDGDLVKVAIQRQEDWVRARNAFQKALVTVLDFY